jgi:hypothetical protein
VQERGYAVKDEASLTFAPTALGEALIGAYDRMGLKAVYECVPRAPAISCVRALCCTLCVSDAGARSTSRVADLTSRRAERVVCAAVAAEQAMRAVQCGDARSV